MKTETKATPSPTNDKKRRPRWQRVLRGLFGFGIVFIVAGLVALFAYGLRAQRELAALEAEIRAKGEPLTPEELEAFYPQIPDEENGALVYLKAVEELASFWDEKDGYHPEYFWLDNELGEKDLSYDGLFRLRLYIESRASVFALLEEAGRYPRARYPVDLGDLRVERTVYSGISKLKDLLILRGRYAIHYRDWKDFEESQRQVLELSRSLESMPDLTAQLNRSRIVYSSRNLVEQALREPDLPVTLLHELDALYAGIDFGQTLQMLTIGSRAVYAARMDAFYDDGPSVFREDDRELLDRYRPYRFLPGYQLAGTMEKLRGLRFHTSILDDHELAWPARFNNTIARLAFDPGQFTLIPEERRTRHAFARKALRILDSVPFSSGYHEFNWYDMHVWTDGLVFDELQRRLLRLALRVEGYHAENGEFPTSLSVLGADLLEEVGTDPFSGLPIIYRTVHDGFQLYAAGPDAIDNMGDPRKDAVLTIKPGGHRLFVRAPDDKYEPRDNIRVGRGGLLGSRRGGGG